MKYAFAQVAFGLGAHALVPRDAPQCVQITASGGASGILGQYTDGQNRIGGGYPAACYCLSNGGFTDSSGRGCILTGPSTQWQCDQGASPTTGFAIGSNGGVTYNGSPTFYACPYNDQGGYNVYSQPAPNQTKCVKITLASAGSCGKGAQSSPAPSPSPAQMTCPAPVTVTAPAPAPVTVTPPAQTQKVTVTAQATCPAPVTVTPPAQTQQVTVTAKMTCPAPVTMTMTAPAPPAVTVTAQATCPAPMTVTAPAQTQKVTVTAQATCPAPMTVTAPAQKPSTVTVTAQAPQMTCPAPVTVTAPAQKVTVTAPAQNMPPTTVTVTAPAQNTPAPQPSKPVAQPSMPAQPAGSCPADLNGNYQYPHLIVPVNSGSPNKAYGTSYNGKVDKSTCSIFNFDIPASYSGKQCSVIFLFPQQKDLQTSSYTTSGSGSCSFSQLSSPATQSTSWSNAPSKKMDLGSMSIAPGNSYTIASGACAAGQTVSYEMCSSGDYSLDYFQDYNPSPIGMYVRSC